jgi:DNA-directed RNA polymerase specialized sigma24 family protein
MTQFNTTKEELARLGSQFNSEALPLADKFYNTSFWILLDKKSARKILKQTYFKAIEYCDKTKAYADWQSWMHRIWIKNIFDFYEPKENDVQTIFDFIDLAETDFNEVKNLFNSDKLKSNLLERDLIKSLKKIPSVLRVPLILKEIHSLNYNTIAELIDVPDGVIVTRIYRARKLLFLFLRGNFNYQEQKKNGLSDSSPKIIFDIRRCALLVDGEFTDEQKSEFSKTMKGESLYETEVLIQDEIKTLFLKLSFDSVTNGSLKAKIAKRAIKRFRNH